MTIKAARLDAAGVYQGIDELPDDSALTPSHLEQITRCDLQPGQYKWIADANNPYGGAFWPLKWLDLQDRLQQDIAAAHQRRQIALSGRPAERRAASERKPRPRRN